MRILMALLSMIAALTLIGLGVTSAFASTTETAPCHEAASSSMASHHGANDDPAPETPAQAMKVMACCIACVSISPLAPDLTRIRLARPGLESRPQPVRTGLSPIPEPEPPKA